MRAWVHLAIVAVAATSCATTTGARPETPASEPALPSAATSAPSIPPTTVTSTTVKPVDAGQKLAAADTGLPPQYLTERGDNTYGEPRGVSMRADLRDFAVAVRAAHPDLADQLGWTLQTMPWAVCVLGPTLPGGWDGYVQRADTLVAAVAAAARAASHQTDIGGDEFSPIPVDWPVPPTAINDAGIADAYAIAATMFCPADGSERRGDPAEHLPRWKPDSTIPIEPHEQWLPWWALDNPGFGDVKAGTTAWVGAAYAVTAAVPTLAVWTAAEAFAVGDGNLCFGDMLQLHTKLAELPTPPDFWAQMDYNLDLTTDDVRDEAVLHLTGQAVVEIGCRSFVAA